MNRRRLDNFRRNKRGAWSLRIFLVLFVASLCAEFIANDRPLVASYKGEILFPVFFDYPEDKFGGFEAHADYRGSFVANEIKAHGWMIWPPIRFANSTTILNPPTPLPTPPTWMLSDAQCRAALAKRGEKDAAALARPCRALEPLWLGSDQDGHDIVARLIYGFRLSVLFGLTLAGVSSVIGVFAGAVQGYFGGWLDLDDAEGDRNLVVAAAPLCSHHPVGDPGAELLRAVDDPAAVLLGQSRASGAG